MKIKFLEKRKCRKLIKSQENQIREFKKIMEKYETLPHEPKELLKTLVEFFNEVSNFQDHNYFNDGFWLGMGKYYPDSFANLQKVSLHLQSSGRSCAGMNRSKVKELVSDCSVYLGGIYGVSTFDVFDWLRTSKSAVHIDILDKDTGKPIWLTKLVAEKQARPFMEAHTSPVVETCRRLLSDINKL